MLTNLIPYFAFFCSLLLAKKEFDKWLIVKKGIYPKHGLEIAVVAFLCGLSMFLLFGLKPVIVGIGAVSMAVWWFWFDYELNIARKLEATYIGSTSELDKFLRIEPKWQYHFKGLVLVIAIVILLITINL